jgi:glutamate synthase domain-containing protein 3
VSVIDCEGKTIREINQTIRRLADEGAAEIRLTHPSARHNLGVGLIAPVHLIVEGSVGYYCAGMIDGPAVSILGSAGWGVGEGMMTGTIVVEGNAGNGAAASIRGGTVVVRGDAAARTAIALKGGTVIVGGSVGYMSGFMMQKGALIVCGDAGEGLGDSMYEGTIFIAGRIAELGHDAVVEEPAPEDLAMIAAHLERYRLPDPGGFKKVVSGRRLWNFDKREWEIWKNAL